MTPLRCRSIRPRACFSKELLGWKPTDYVTPRSRFGESSKCAQGENTNDEKYRCESGDQPGDSARDGGGTVGADVITRKAEDEIREGHNKCEANNSDAQSDGILDELTPMTDRNNDTQRHRRAGDRNGSLKRARGSPVPVHSRGCSSVARRVGADAVSLL